MSVGLWYMNISLRMGGKAEFEETERVFYLYQALSNSFRGIRIS